MEYLWAKVTDYGIRMPNLTCCDGSVSRVFVYGTLKNGQPNFYNFLNPCNGKARFIGKGRTATPYPLIIATKWNLPFLLHAENQGEIVEGEIYEVDDTMMSWLDDFEGHPEVYEREKIKIVTDCHRLIGNSDTKTVDCWVYFLKKYPDNLLALSALGCYDAMGDHGRTYKADSDLSGPDNIYEALLEERVK